MADLLHRIKIFVYRFQEERPDYLLLRAAGHESFWGPLQGPLGFGEKLESAIRREVHDDVGLSRPAELIDLQMPARWVVGDEEVIEWNFGIRTPAGEREPSLGPGWADYVWADFSRAYPSLELDGDRAAILRLHTLLRAA